jgi:hypothetical protein
MGRLHPSQLSYSGEIPVWAACLLSGAEGSQSSCRFGFAFAVG